MDKISPIKHQRDRRRPLIPLMGISILGTCSIPLIVSFSSAQSQGSTVTVPDIYAQTDDVLREPQEKWPPMTPEQKAQARATLIEKGFSPMEADGLLPYAKTP